MLVHAGFVVLAADLTVLCLFWTLSAPSWRLLCCLGCLKCPGSRLNLLRPVSEPSWGFLGAILAPSWATLGCFRSVLGHLGLCWAILALSCGCLGPSWACLGPAWACLGLSWAYLGPRWLKMAQDGSKMAQDGSKMTPRWPKMSPRWAKNRYSGSSTRLNIFSGPPGPLDNPQAAPRRDHFGVISGFFSGPFLGSIPDQFLAPFWLHFGSLLAPF